MMRACGDCQLCCKLLPVAEGMKVDGMTMPGSFHKPAGQRCIHQRHHKGCAVYNSPKMPRSCRLWNCAWLTNNDTADLRRPDRSHYVIDIMPDFVTTRDNETGVERKVPVLQVWLDPDYPDAHRDPALRAFLARRGEEGNAALIRLDNKRAFALFPPALSTDGEWHEVTTGTVEGQHTAAEVIDVLMEAQA